MITKKEIKFYEAENLIKQIITYWFTDIQLRIWNKYRFTLVNTM
jgi:hypothetical protein